MNLRLTTVMLEKRKWLLRFNQNGTRASMGAISFLIHCSQLSGPKQAPNLTHTWCNGTWKPHIAPGLSQVSIRKDVMACEFGTLEKANAAL